MKVVLDCNVIISAGLTDGTCRKVMLEIFQNHSLYISEDILLEYGTVISRAKFKPVREYLYSLIERICEVSELVTITRSKVSLPDKNDLIYLDTALPSGAQYLITGNGKDFPETKYHNTTIITPAEFLNLQLAYA
jgi:uncharacterized protein